MADGNVIAGVKKIIESDPSRRFVVVSAPGKRYSGDIKVTDLLYACHKEAIKVGSCKNSFAQVRARFEDIAKQLNLSFDISSVLDRTERRIEQEKNEDFTASRGEYLSARIMAEFLGAKFIDTEEVIFFTPEGNLDGAKSYKAISSAVAGCKLAVFPGFYGADENGRVKTFSRGGSDITGSIVARAVNASLYENWTDVSGFLACDPRIVDAPKRIKTLSYKELRELSYMGVTGIAGKKNFTVIYIEKSLMNSEIGFVRKVLSVVEDEGVPIEHIPSGIDTMSLVIASDELENFRLERILEGIKNAVEPDIIRVIENIALIATVGHGMSSSVGTSARLFNAIAAADINIKMIDQGSSELNIVVAVKDDDYERCIKAIYREFFGRGT